MAILKVDTISGIGTEGPVFEGDIEFTSQNFLTLPKGDTSQRGRGRGFYAIGFANPTQSDNIDFLNIQSTGNTTTFGSLTTAKYNLGSGASSTRGIFCGGYDPSSSPDTDINSIEYITIATTGNAIDFGDRTVVGRAIAAASSSTRVVMAGGYTPAGTSNVIDFITTATTGNAQDFGDLLSAANAMCTSNNSSTRGIFAGGNATPSSPYNTNVIQFVTIATTGNAIEFGDLNETMAEFSGSASRIEAAFSGGSPNSSTMKNTIEFVTIATSGNAQDFGDLTAAKYHASSTSSGHGGI